MGDVARYDPPPAIDFDTTHCPEDDHDHGDGFTVRDVDDEVHDVTKGFDIQLRDGSAVVVKIACSCGFEDESVIGDNREPRE